MARHSEQAKEPITAEKFVRYAEVEATMEAQHAIIKELEEELARTEAPDEEPIRRDERQRIVSFLRTTTLSGVGGSINAEPTAGDSPRHAASRALLAVADMLMTQNSASEREAKARTGDHSADEQAIRADERQKTTEAAAKSYHIFSEEQVRADERRKVIAESVVLGFGQFTAEREIRRQARADVIAMLRTQGTLAMIQAIPGNSTSPLTAALDVLKGLASYLERAERLRLD